MCETECAWLRLLVGICRPERGHRTGHLDTLGGLSCWLQKRTPQLGNSPPLGSESTLFWRIGRVLLGRRLQRMAETQCIEVTGRHAKPHHLSPRSRGLPLTMGPKKSRGPCPHETISRRKPPPPWDYQQHGPPPLWHTPEAEAQGPCPCRTHKQQKATASMGPMSSEEP